MSDDKPGVMDRLFELRTIVAVLFGVYGVFCLIWGFGFTTADEIRRAAGINMNLMMGVVMLVASVGFSLWVVARPVETAPTQSEADADQGTKDAPRT